MILKNLIFSVIFETLRFKDSLLGKVPSSHPISEIFSASHERIAEGKRFVCRDKSKYEELKLKSWNLKFYEWNLGNFLLGEKYGFERRCDGKDNRGNFQKFKNPLNKNNKKNKFLDLSKTVFFFLERVTCLEEIWKIFFSKLNFQEAQTLKI